MKNQVFCCVFAMCLVTAALGNLVDEGDTSAWLEQVKRTPAAGDDLLQEFLNGVSRHRSSGRFGKRSSEPFGTDSDLVGERSAMNRLLWQLWHRSQQDE
ncbi:Hypp6416 [Branchiostoma lanceolatum]|uniref:Hypp6416 protein n=1 Tax=Branchiostoma lanceolatum TaxID=7740 RepID=A0A8J9YU47_BRALA|nr:Hypp6416 [Branchiostoma lanceolatum]